MAIQYYKQDLTSILANKEFQVFAHGCNCFCTMGAGIARTVKELYPSVYEADKHTEKGNPAKLGTICPVLIDENKYIINAYTQFKFWSKLPDVDYKAIKHCFIQIRDFMQEFGFTELTIPKIGAGLAGGDWNTIEARIKAVFPDNFSIKIFYL